MKRIIAICEGQTEQVFCERTLSPFFIANDCFVQAPRIKRSKGGIVKWPFLKREIENHLKSDKKAYVTTFIDYYGLYQKHNFPGWDEAAKIADKNNRMTVLEESMKKDIGNEYQSRFIPYIQLHEFEGLLFNDINIFQELIPPHDLLGLEELRNVFMQYPNPEMINDNVETCPSKRLKRIIAGYNKILYGDFLAGAIGLNRIREKSPRFNNWINILNNLNSL